jgi:hypothetical protein
MTKYAINWHRMGLALVCFIHENNYFGWNRSPQSPEEVLADSFVVLIVALSISRERE